MSMFASLLDKRAEDVERPPLLPVGQYVVQVRTHPSMEEERSDTWATIEFPLAVVAASEGIDEDELAAFGNPAGALLRRAFMFDKTDSTQQARVEYQLRQFLEMIGALSDESETMKEGIANSVGAQFIAEVWHKPRKNDPEQFDAEVRRVYAL